MIIKKLAVRSFLFFAIFCMNLTAYSAPLVPQELLASSLIYCTSASGFSFDPQKADVGTNMNVVTEQIYDKLIEFDPETNSLKPSLAKSYTVSDDGLVITFYLRKKVKFHTTKWFNPTRDFNADDVLFSLNRVRGNVDDLPELKELDRVRHNGKHYNNYIFQRQARKTHFPYFESINLKSKITNISAPSKYVVKITLAEPDSSLLAHLASQYAVILSKEYALQLSSDDNLAQLDQLPVGTGVYQLQSYVNNEYVRLHKNANYWGRKAKIDNIIIDFSASGTGKMAKFLNKECDISAFPEPSQLSVLSKGYFVNTSGANLSFLAFNFQRPTMKNRELRQKIARSIDRYRLGKRLFYGIAEVADNILPTALFPTKDPDNYPYNPQYESKENIDPLVLKLWVVDEKHVYNSHPLKMAELIKYDLARVGIKIDVRQVNRAFLVQQLQKRTADYDLILTGWLANNFDPDNFLSAILGCRSQFSVTNLANWCNRNVDLLLNKARMSENNNERIKLYKKVEEILRNELPILPLLNVSRLLLVSNKVKNVKISPFGSVNLSQMELILPEN
ncbi:ABC transporter substrate-binding protein [Phocoenobacter skyensis]|uniref:ABC transporter substrate-binding protein n=1 Tax=Phocoenobacter skyensis TaxID=97481 RepID=A0A1H7U4U3_9PAST|nr:ABC transporter substrate-binding protein [Pasteurella skyensis]MDP8078751.1 ABC transporter substrate-binding protein [Pasteurella skyensis]MDP8084746.1 ABC transporter substrate-binding protein [Pasteurella skyensis]MDP8170184.1 ABC transporter substrate-binding protein [Pasteurella skyensis]MDP8184108.1 ABC transporter substrate-binding protein [Pasteurella skyensis]SEL92001.1 cationic peptide transport system substrate-binding protein [Pasteurella skyensis]